MYRIPEDEIVRVVLNPDTKRPISPVTLRKHFAEDLKQGFVNGKMRLMAAQFQSATGIKDAAGTGWMLPPNVTAQIWLGKVLLGQREQVAVDVPLTPEAEESEGEVTLEAARRIAFVMRMGAQQVRARKA